MSFGRLALPTTQFAQAGRREICYVLGVGLLASFLCSRSVTELGFVLSRAGGWLGWHVYSHRVFGERIRFVVGSCDWIVQSVANAYLASLCSTAAGQILIRRDMVRVFLGKRPIMRRRSIWVRSSRWAVLSPGPPPHRDYESDLYSG
jgi:hypothetical protein